MLDADDPIPDAGGPIIYRLIARLHLRPTTEGGRMTPIGTGGIYRPQFRIGEAETYGPVESIHVGDSAVSTLAPGQQADATILIPMRERFNGMVEPGARFDICEGPRCVGWGTILRASVERYRATGSGS